jgi:arylsulfatase
MSNDGTSIDPLPPSDFVQSPKVHGLSRRNLLLSGTTLAAASALASVAPMRSAQAQAQPTASGQRPNILVIFGDDIGLANVSAYSHGLMGYRTPNIDRIAKKA